MVDSFWQRRHQRLFQLFEAAADLPPGQRGVFLDQACLDDTALRLQVQAMLEADRQVEAGGFLEKLRPDLTVLRPPPRPDAAGPAWPVLAGPAGKPLQLGPYVLLERLGRGGMGVVHRARHQATGELAAVKTVELPHQAMLEGLRREIRSLSRLRHPGIVRIYEEGLHAGLPWYAMELLEGTPLSDCWARGSHPPLEQALGLVHALCAPLGYLHGEGLVHRDLKPQNILLRPDGSVVLIDFGLLAAFSGEIHRDALELEVIGAGTPAYMAPEQIRGESCDARVDLYALGCLLFALLTGRRVFETKTHAEMLAAHLFREPPKPSQFVAGLPGELDELLLHLLAKEPRQRLGYADDVAAALERLGVPVQPRGEPKARAYLYRPGFSGRSLELERLRACVQQATGRTAPASAGRTLDGPVPTVVFVAGQSGIGKTRLALEVARDAARQQIEVLMGETLLPEQQGRAAGLSPLRLPLQRLADRCRERGLAEAERVFGARARLLSAYEPALLLLPGYERHPEPPELPPQDARTRLLEALEAVFDAAALAEPLLLILDDLQWADELTLAFLERVLRAEAGPGRPARQPAQRLWLLLGLYRSEDAEAALQGLVSLPGAVRIELGRLEPAAVGWMIAEMLALPTAPPLFSRFVDRHSEGNPFFVAEYLRMALEESVLWRDDEGVWQLTEPGGEAREEDYEALPWPRSLLEVVSRRLRSLPDRELRLAEAASVLGREVDARLLHRLAMLHETERDSALQELFRRQVLEEPRPGQLRFVHDKLREGAYGQIEEARRRSLHRAAAEGLEALEPGRQFLAEQAHHWEHAGESERARPLYLAAAQAAETRHVLEQAERLYRAFLRLTPEPTPQSIEARLELGCEVLHSLGRNPEARAELDQGLAETRSLGLVRLEARCLRLIGTIESGHLSVEQVWAYYEQSRQLSRQAGDPEGEALTLIKLGDAKRNQGRLDEALELYQQALELQPSIGEPRSQARLLGNMAALHGTAGRIDEARALAERALEVLRPLEDLRMSAILVGHLAMFEMAQGRFEPARQRYEEALEMLRKAGNPRAEAMFLSNLSMLHAEHGQVEEAWKRAQQALDLARQIGSWDSVGIGLGHLARLELLRTGDARQAAALSDEGLRLLEASGQLRPLAEFLCGRGEIALALGEPGREWLERAETIARDLGSHRNKALDGLLSHLQRAIEAVERGEHHRVFRGRLLEDLQPGLRHYCLQRLAALPEARSPDSTHARGSPARPRAPDEPS